MSGVAASAADPQAAAALLRSTDAVRERAAALLARARRGESQWFTSVGDDALQDTARVVADVTRERYPSGAIPYHSRWRHFEAGGVDRLGELNRMLGDVDARERRARAHRPGAGERAARCRRGRGLALCRSRPPASASRAPRGWASPASTPSRAACSRPTPSNRCRPMPPACARWRPSSSPTPSRSAQPTRWSASTAAPRCCAGSARRCASSPNVFGDEGRPGGLFDALVGRRAATRCRLPSRRARHPLAAARLAVAHLAAPAMRSAARPTLPSPWATAGATPPCAARASATAGCRSTSSRSGSSIRCSSPSSGPACRCATSMR